LRNRKKKKQIREDLTTTKGLVFGRFLKISSHFSGNICAPFVGKKKSAVVPFLSLTPVILKNYFTLAGNEFHHERSLKKGYTLWAAYGTLLFMCSPL